MAYNKAKEEKKWRLWKEAEEKQLRSLGVNEDDIEKLRVHDWTIFNSDRRYYQRVQETGTYLDELVEDTTQPEVKTEYSARDCAPQPLKLSIHSGGIEHPCRCR